MIVAQFTSSKAAGLRTSVPSWLRAGGGSQFLTIWVFPARHFALAKPARGILLYPGRVKMIACTYCAGESESKTEVTILRSLIKEVTSHPLCRIFFVRSKSLVQPCTQGKERYFTRVWIPGGRDHWDSS